MNLRPDRGQATVELVLVLPIVVLTVLATVQVAVVARAEVLTVHGAREGARAAAVGASDDAVRAAVVDRTGFDDGRLTVRVVPAGDVVTVEVRYHQPTDLAVIGTFVGDVEHTASVTLWREDR